MSAPTYTAVLALIDALKGIRGSGSGYFNDFGARVYTAELDPAINGHELGLGGWIVVRWNGEDIQDPSNDWQGDHALAETEIGVDVWLPETIAAPGVSNAMEVATKAGLDLLKAVNVVFSNGGAVKCAWVQRIVRGTGGPGPAAKLIATVRFAELIDYAAIGP